MTSNQITTLRGCVGIVIALFLVGLATLGVEMNAIVNGDHSTISELIWGLWARQPWVIWLVSVLGAFIGGFFSGHFVGQASDVYDWYRGKK